MIGDRYRHTPTGLTIEVISEYSQRVVENPDNFNNYKIGYVSSWGDLNTVTSWDYIGNFSKSNSFKRLYNKLNGNK